MSTTPLDLPTQPVAASRGPISRRVRAAVLAALCCGVLILGWSQFGPVQLGGSASYVVTDGVSMLPSFHAGGLVITRQQDSYHIGEVVAYHNKRLHTVVMHRIVARDGSRYVFKGDNNDFRDHYHPTKSELVGAEWVYWPDGGRYLTMLRQPVTFAIVIGLLGLFAATGFAPARTHRRRRHHR